MGNSASSLPYSIGKQVVPLINDGWSLHDGSRKSDGMEVSVFVAKKPILNKTPLNRRNPHITQYIPAKHHFTHCKKLRHPHIIQVMATLDTDHPNDSTQSGATGSFSSSSSQQQQSSSSTNANETGDWIVVTESCITLEEWLTKYKPTVEQIAWGLESIVKALHFLHTSDSCFCHGNLHPSSFFVTKSGDVKLWNFSLVTSMKQGSDHGSALMRHFVEYEELITPDLYRSPERVEKRWDAIIAAGSHVMDSYALGVLIEHLFNGEIPQKLLKAVQRLQTTSLKMRPKLLPLLKCPVFDTPYQKLQLQLAEIAIQPVEQKIAFWHSSLLQLQDQVIPELLAVHKLFPLIQRTIETVCTTESMKSQDMYRREVHSTLGAFFYIAETYLSKEDRVSIRPHFKLLFTVNDRAVRGVLLQKIPFLEQTLDNEALNSAVFEPMCSGFSDSSTALRELTLKATSILVPHLSHPNLEKLSRYLVRLQGDTEPIIRTNTVIFFSKLAPYLTETTRQKMLLPAFVRAMKDPFMPCRNAAMASMLKAKQFFDPEAIASRVLPCITPRLVDPAPEVRQEAFLVVEEFLSELRIEHNRLNSLPQAQPQSDDTGNNFSANTSQSMTNSSHAAATTSIPSNSVPADQQQPSRSPASGFSFGISSWIGGSTSSSKAPTPPPPVNPAPLQTSYQEKSIPTIATTTSSPSSFAIPKTSNTMDDDWDDNDGAHALDNFANADADGWVDDDIDDFIDINGTAKNQVQLTGQASKSFVTPTAQENSRSSLIVQSSMLNDTGDEFFDAFEGKAAKPVVAAKKFASTSTKLVVPKPKTSKLHVPTKPVIKKLSTDEKQLADGWDDF